jgi:hypothetical protein
MERSLSGLDYQSAGEYFRPDKDKTARAFFKDF